ncbi:hypothetical protein F511_22306 [Dorcoceras hygrometricum]|uniref:Uncharacterized protein n=1 Tax=Dorcoceras hygrometricum TaxID=472368 RepID=A0A2Z7DGP2_9LAMI|nr:hypothetical protein F511_22306 [Dorcoceras hygrometricum]
MGNMLQRSDSDLKNWDLICSTRFAKCFISMLVASRPPTFSVSSSYLCTMSSPSTSLVGSTAESIDSASPIIQAGEPWLPEPGELPTTPWYEEKASTLRLSDISIVKEKGGTMGKFELPQAPFNPLRPHAISANQEVRTGEILPLEDVKSRAARDAERLKLEGREEFLKSSEFDTLLGKKAGGFFKNGFLGCVAQWRANGYSEDEHPAPFLNPSSTIRAVHRLELGMIRSNSSFCANNLSSGLHVCVEELRDFASAELGLCAELVRLTCLRRRATRLCQCGTGLMCRAGRAFASLPVRNWAYVPSWSGFCVEELREFASAELGLCAELGGLVRSLSGGKSSALRPWCGTFCVTVLPTTLSSSPLGWHLVSSSSFPQTAPIDVAK